MPSGRTLSHLCAVTLARADELAQRKPNAAVLAACYLFMADAVRAAQRTPTFITRSLPVED